MSQKRSDSHSLKKAKFKKTSYSATVNKELHKLLSFLETKQNVFNCGDFNARHTSYGDNFYSQRANLIKTILESTDFRRLNIGSWTFKNRIHDSDGSVLDLSFTNLPMNLSSDIYNNIIIKSHHITIILEIENVKNKIQKILTKRSF